MAKNEFVATIVAFTCISMFIVGLAIPTVYYGFHDEDATCQHGTRGGLDLSEWTKGMGLEKLVYILMMYVFLGLTFINEIFAVVVLCTVVLDIIFSSIWLIWGIVILATNENNSCVAEGKGMAVMAIINIVLTLVMSSSSAKSSRG